MWYEWKGWTAVSSIADIIIGILTLITMGIALYQLIDNKTTKIGIFSMFDEGNIPMKHYDKIYKMHCDKKYLKIMKLQAHKNKIMIVMRNKSNYPIEIFKYKIYIKRNIIVGLLLHILVRFYKINYELYKTNDYTVYFNSKKRYLEPNESKIIYVSLDKFKILDILFYEKFVRLGLLSMQAIISIECYPKKIEKRLNFSLYKIRKYYEENYNAIVGIAYYIYEGVFCKPFLHKIAKSFCRLLHLHFVGNCKTSAGSYSASPKPLQIIFSCYNTRYGNGSSEFSSSCACSLK